MYVAEAQRELCEQNSTSGGMTSDVPQASGSLSVAGFEPGVARRSAALLNDRSYSVPHAALSGKAAGPVDLLEEAPDGEGIWTSSRVTSEGKGKEDGTSAEPRKPDATGNTGSESYGEAGRTFR